MGNNNPLSNYSTDSITEAEVIAAQKEWGGNYYFTTLEGNEVKVEYTFGYVKDQDSKVRIAVHKSALPYDPSK